jgi:hypothetical protein
LNRLSCSSWPTSSQTLINRIPPSTMYFKALGRGDVRVVTRSDRLARSTRDLLNTLDQVAKAGTRFRSVADPMIDTTSPRGKLNLGCAGSVGRIRTSVTASGSLDY